MHAINAETLGKVYDAASQPVRALDGLSLEVAQGQIYGLLGPNGAGKSTLVKILTTITAPTSGRAWVHGFDVERQALEVRKRITVVLQQTAVDTLLSVEDNLRLYGYLHGLNARDVDRRLRPILEEFELAEQSRKTVQDLSIGTKRRVQIAKIFMVDSPVIFLDECTTGMDPIMKRRVLDRIRQEARQGRTVLLTTQVLTEAEELCDTVMIIHNGKTLASGSLQELRKLSHQMFRVSLVFGGPADGLRPQLESWQPSELRIEGEKVEMLFRGEESSLLGKLAELSRGNPIRHFEIHGAGLEDIFVELVSGEQHRTGGAA